MSSMLKAGVQFCSSASTLHDNTHNASRPGSPPRARVWMWVCTQQRHDRRASKQQGLSKHVHMWAPGAQANKACQAHQAGLSNRRKMQPLNSAHTANMQQSPQLNL